MSLFMNITLDGLTQGLIFAALALSLVLIFRATKIINFAQGAMAMITTFVASSLLNRGWGTGGPFCWHWSWVSCSEPGRTVLIRPLEGKPELNPVIVTIGLRDRARGAGRRRLRNSSRGFPAAFSQSGLEFGHTEVGLFPFRCVYRSSRPPPYGRKPGFVQGYDVRPSDAGVGLRPRGVTIARRPGRAASHAAGGSRRRGRRAGGLVDRPHEFLRAVLHGPRPDLAFTAAVIGGLEAPSVHWSVG